MKDDDHQIARAISGLIAAGLLGGGAVHAAGSAAAQPTSDAIFAQGGPPPVALPQIPMLPQPGAREEMEQCYGIAKAGKNDCNTDTSVCGGTSTRDGQKDAYIFLPAGTCQKIVGGFLRATPRAGPPPVGPLPGGPPR